jgi:hypothetical protein
LIFFFLINFSLIFTPVVKHGAVKFAVLQTVKFKKKNFNPQDKVAALPTTNGVNQKSILK